MVPDDDLFSELLGAYALDAVDPDEREAIERHLVDCPRCRAEVAEHREVAAYLSHTGSAAPEGVWDRIAAELEPPAPPMRMTVLPGASAAPAASGGPIRSSRRPSRPMLAVLAVAACIIVVLGAVVVAQRDRIGGSQTIEERANDAIADSKLKVDLTGDHGSARAVVGPDGQGYLIMDGVSEPAEGEVYQLWGKVDETVLSLGTFGGAAVVPFSVDPARIGDIELFAVTQERAPGVVASTEDPILAGTV